MAEKLAKEGSITTERIRARIRSCRTHPAHVAGKRAANRKQARALQAKLDDYTRMVSTPGWKGSTLAYHRPGSHK